MGAATAPKGGSRRWFLSGGAGQAPDPVAHIADACLARAGVVCQACADACPERAIGFQLQRGGAPLPRVREDRCSSCGACVAVCPVGAIAVPGQRA